MKYTIITICLLIFLYGCNQKYSNEPKVEPEKEFGVNTLDSTTIRYIAAAKVILKPDSLSLQHQIPPFVQLVKKMFGFIINEPLKNTQISENELNDAFLRKFRPELSKNMVNACRIIACDYMINNYGVIESSPLRSSLGCGFYSLKIQTEYMQLCQIEPLSVIVSINRNKPSYVVNGKVYNYSLQISNDYSSPMKLYCEVEVLIDDEIARPIYDKRSKILENEKSLSPSSR
jgi:hypothetical protein